MTSLPAPLATAKTSPWDTTMIRTHGPSSLTPEEVHDFDQLWNRQAAAD